MLWYGGDDYEGLTDPLTLHLDPGASTFNGSNGTLRNMEPSFRCSCDSPPNPPTRLQCRRPHADRPVWSSDLPVPLTALASTGALPLSPTLQHASSLKLLRVGKSRIFRNPSYRVPVDPPMRRPWFGRLRYQKPRLPWYASPSKASPWQDVAFEWLGFTFDSSLGFPGEGPSGDSHAGPTLDILRRTASSAGLSDADVAFFGDRRFRATYTSALQSLSAPTAIIAARPHMSDSDRRDLSLSLPTDDDCCNPSSPFDRNSDPAVAHAREPTSSAPTLRLRGGVGTRNREFVDDEYDQISVTNLQTRDTDVDDSNAWLAVTVFRHKVTK